MVEDDDPWPTGIYRLMPDEHAHALGTLLNYYNNAENMLLKLVDILLKNDQGARQTINHRLNNSERLDLLRQLATEKSVEENDHILYAVTCFDIAAENRNILMHAMIEQRPLEEFSARKRHATKAGVEVHFDLPLSALRTTAEQTANTYYYIMLLWTYFVQKLVHAAEWRPTPPSLPDKPPRPSKLSLLPPP
jgi:hypothetical protein